MSKDIKWLDGNRIQVDPPKRTKKVTGTRFATILGLNPWATEFEMWCAITKTYEKPFEDNIYTIAGKTIEPKQADYMENSYGMEIIRPSDLWGEDYFKKTWGDFFPENQHLGGMWDYLAKDETGEVEAVLEMKTTKRAEDWKEDVPEYYALQAALYAYLYGVDDVIMVASFLQGKDYEKPDSYVPDAKNTAVMPFKVSERYPDFKMLVDRVETWWKNHVETGISPPYDENKDADILKALRTSTYNPQTNTKDLVKEAEGLKAELDKVAEETKDKEKRLIEITGILKKQAIDHFTPYDTRMEIKGDTYTWTVTKTTKTQIGVDEELMKQDGILDKYLTTTTSTNYRMTVAK